MNPSIMAIKQSRWKSFLDFVFILVSSIGTLSMVQFVTFNVLPIPGSVGLFLFTFSAYIIRFGVTIRGLGHLIRKSILFFLLTMLYTWEIFQGFIVGDETVVVLVRLLFLCSAYISCAYFYKLLKIHKSFGYFIRPYCYYALYVIFTITLLAILVKAGIISPFANRLANNSLIADNFDYHVYYFPSYLSIIIDDPSVFFGNFGLPMICGLSHEPQLNCFAILPGCFLLIFLFSSKKNIEYIVCTLLVLVCLLCTSFTAIVCTLIVLMIHFLWNFIINKNYYGTIFFFIILIVFGILFVSWGYYDVFISYMNVKADFDNSKSSGSVSVGLLDYIVSSNSFLGQGIFCSQDDIKSGTNNRMGYISAFFALLFYLQMLLTAIRNCFSKKIVCHVVGLAGLYFCFHALKYGIVLFKYNYLFFIVFVLFYSDNILKTKSSSNI